MKSYRIGIDVGGTHTDAVIMDESYNVLAEVKSPTSEDVSSGIYEAMRDVVEKSGVPKEQIQFAMLGTTHCTNAIVERKKLNKVAAIRIGAPATLAIRPLLDIPEDLAEKLGDHIYLVEGGHEFDGKEIISLDKEHLRTIAQEIRGKVNSVAITSVFSPVSKVHETRAAEIIHEELGDSVTVSLSSEIGSIGLLERENATILNASLIDVVNGIANGFTDALRKEEIEAAVFFGQNDGTLMSLDYTVKYPILTIACGPTNSLRGASYLAAKADALVVDVGGTTTDIGVLTGSFPRESSLAVEIGGVRTNFRMPDIISIGLGGGTIVRLEEDGEFTIGPDSVGHRLHEKGLLYGGDTLTTTDVVVALGKAELGNPDYLNHLNKEHLKNVYNKMVDMVEEAIDKMKTSADDVPVVLVGGGSILFPTELQGASEVIKTENFGVANAIGSAISQVSGQIEKVFDMDELGREQTIEKAKEMAKDEAISAGADPEKLVIVDVEDLPLAYLSGNASKVRVKAAGDLMGAMDKQVIL